MSKKSRDLASAAMALLAERFPRCFDERNRRPLKIGINADVVVAMAGTMPARDVANALRFYTGSVLYQRALTAGAGRLDLGGKLAGTVTPQQEAAALTKQRAGLRGRRPGRRVRLKPSSKWLPGRRGLRLLISSRQPESVSADNRQRNSPRGSRSRQRTRANPLNFGR
jgi:sRNA-binding protein